VGLGDICYSWGMTTTSTDIPRTIRALITEVEVIGGEVIETQARRFDFHLPCRVVGGEVRLVNRGAVGYFVRDGKNVIRGVAAIRTEIAYWARQSGRA
jgi:hypothetical protein